MSKLHALLFIMTVTICACKNENRSTSTETTDTTTSLQEAARNTMSDVKDALNGNQDSNFVVDATRMNMAELKVLQEGIDKGTSKDVRSHAKMMMTDHRKLGAAVESYAKSKGYMLPGEDNDKGTEIISDLNKNTRGADWDKAWVNHMIDAHDDAISRFEKGRDNVNDSALKMIILDALPKLRSHKDMMLTEKEKMQ